ncbi:LysM domain-containing protein [Candidatus Gracilibacteria bacterium]|nr:LysM domain-containing protein [Candidatus Gracilibacteria bacterium]
MNTISSTLSSNKTLSNVNPILRIGGQFFSAAAIASMISAPSFARASSKSDVNLNFEAFNKPAIIQIEKNPPKPNFEMISYQIKKGDSLSKLAQKFGVKMTKIMEINPEITDKDVIKTGNTIQIPCRYKLLSKKFPKAKVSDNIEKIAKVPEVLKKEILSVDSNIKSLVTYLGIYKKRDLGKILNSSISQDNKNGAILDLFLEDSREFKNKPVVQEINEIKFDDGLEKSITQILTNGGYEGATVYNLLSTITKVETSGGNFYDSVKLAQNTTDEGRRTYYIKQAVKRSLGKDNDLGPFQITPGWIKTEIKNSGIEFNGKINDNMSLLKQKLIKSFTYAVEKGLTQEQTKEILIKTDCRFDTEKMAKFILSNFIRNYKQIDSRAKDLSCSNKTKLTVMAYNVGIGGALNRCYALLNGAKSSEVYNTDDIKLRHHILQVSSIENKISDDREDIINIETIPNQDNQIEQNILPQQDRIILAKNTSKEVFRVLGNGTIDTTKNTMSVSNVNLGLDNTDSSINFVNDTRIIANSSRTNKSVRSLVDDNKNRVRYLTSDVLKILTKNVFDPKYKVSARVKKEVISKLSKDPIGVMKKNIKLQREKGESGDLQALRNAQGLQDLLDKCLTEISVEIPTYNKIAA